ncbi:type IV pilus biogenesis protein PilP [Acidocella sp.]|uniref:type IV pilus biogenesis protein PilP n=1 Tax=Acidocella sp. TaxID=50710 RepID=UPI003CFD0B4A
MAMLMPGLALADPAPASNKTTTISQLDALNAQIAVLKQELQIAKLKAGIKNAGNPSTGESAAPTGFPGVAFGKPPQPASAAPAPQDTMPRIVSIDGRGTRLSAVLMMPDGGEIVATRGLGLGDGLTVHDVTASGVNVMKAGNLLPLPFVSAQDSTSAPAVSASQVSVPRPASYPPALPGASQ